MDSLKSFISMTIARIPRYMALDLVLQKNLGSTAALVLAIQHLEPSILLYPKQGGVS